MYLFLALLAPLLMFGLLPGLAWFEERMLDPSTLPPRPDTSPEPDDTDTGAETRGGDAGDVTPVAHPPAGSPPPTVTWSATPGGGGAGHPGPAGSAPSAAPPADGESARTPTASATAPAPRIPAGGSSAPVAAIVPAPALPRDPTTRPTPEAPLVEAPAVPRPAHRARPARRMRPAGTRRAPAAMCAAGSPPPLLRDTRDGRATRMRVRSLWAVRRTLRLRRRRTETHPAGCVPGR